MHAQQGLGLPGLKGLLDPSSELWAGAQALSLRLERATRLLATNVIASAGDASAAASHADGSIQLFGAGNCTSVGMPNRDPAYALALAKDGGVLAAWAQGVNRLVFFDLNAPGCPATSAEAALRGPLRLSLSATGAYLAAQDEGGGLWVGPRGGSLSVVTTLSGPPAALEFSEGEGVLLVIDALGLGGAWNPRNGKLLRSLEVPGGPFAGGDFQGGEARLCTRDGRLVRWDVLRNHAADSANEPGEAPSQRRDGWLELRGTDLFYARAGLSWRPAPVYEPHLPLLSHSRQAACLRLSDVDGVVRYFNARNGQVQPQCFADDWAPVAIQPDGTAEAAGLPLRIFDRLAGTGKDSEVNVRAISESHIMLWTESAPRLDLSIVTTPAKADSSLLKIVDSPYATAIKLISVPLRQGIAADTPAQLLPLQ
ncbi:MAG: hypothetical protein Q8S17_04540 [Humidesulfovibrio sp.]|nr:hypothetical protein [Humidesulfovibrio sp.]